ncbi:MAG: transcriptional regulator [Desulfatibacillum sp.]|nr:transcriptional regulator [Desulfatibacillum sp.]
MTDKGFANARSILKKTQIEMAQILGVSVKAVHSYEQGWRNVPAHVERQLYFLLTRRRDGKTPRKACWTLNKCPNHLKMKCPAWEFKAGTLCWFINGTVCGGEVCSDWGEKMARCRICPVLIAMLGECARDVLETGPEVLETTATVL